MRITTMKVSLAVLLTVIAGVSAAEEMAPSLEDEKRELSNHGQYYPAHYPTVYYPVYRTPYPTHKRPTQYPTGQRPTSHPTPYPTKYPIPRPTPYPVKDYPTRKPYYRPPTRHPSSEPSPEPSPEPSEEPSENPTNSEEPSENPTGSEEPSENPTSSEEPSENPTGSESPTDSFGLPTNLLNEPTIYETICDIQFNQVLGLFCDFIQLNPDIAALLGAPLVTINLFNSRTILAHAKETMKNLGGRKLQEEIVVNSGLVGSINDRERFFNYQFPESLFQDSINKGNANIASANKMTLFAPTNYAFLTLPDGILAEILAPNRSLALTNLLKLHITEGKIDFANLKCDGDLEMINDDRTTTRCRNEFKFQISDGNQISRQPQIVIPNIDAINGFVHVVDQVILPENVFPTESPTRNPTRSPTRNPTGSPTNRP